MDLFSEDILRITCFITGSKALRNSLADHEDVIKVRDQIINDEIDVMSLISDMFNDLEAGYRLKHEHTLCGLIVAITEAGIEEHLEIVYALSAMNWSQISTANRVAKSCVDQILEGIEEPEREKVTKKIEEYKEKYWLSPEQTEPEKSEFSKMQCQECGTTAFWFGWNEEGTDRDVPYCREHFSQSEDSQYAQIIYNPEDYDEEEIERAFRYIELGPVHFQA